ncbi:MAG: hypothetical protein P8Y38_13090 [Deltaproteobacteria bacterium]|jgi:cell division protease FtsH
MRRATEIARAIVSEYGMGETLGLATYPKHRAPVFLNGTPTTEGVREYSEETAAKLDQEIRTILSQREAHVTNLLTSRKETLIRIAEELLDKEVLYANDFKKML